MDGVSSAFAVVSLAIQLVGTVQQISKFTRDVENAPDELLGLADSLDRLKVALIQVRSLLEQQLQDLNLPGPPECLFDALKTCEKKLHPLEKFANRTRC